MRVIADFLGYRLDTELTPSPEPVEVEPDRQGATCGDLTLSTDDEVQPMGTGIGFRRPS